MSAKNKPCIEILERRTVKTENGCWLFMGGKNQSHSEHRRIRVNGKKVLVHRLSWEIHNGAIPDGKWVLHKCFSDGQCWNPDHLYVGTRNDNARDMVVQGAFKNRRGERCNNHKLTDKEVREIRGDLCGFTQKQVAEMYGISYGHLNKIRRNMLWTHIQ